MYNTKQLQLDTYNVELNATRQVAKVANASTFAIQGQMDALSRRLRQTVNNAVVTFQNRLEQLNIPTSTVPAKKGITSVMMEEKEVHMVVKVVIAQTRGTVIIMILLIRPNHSLFFRGSKPNIP